MKTLLRTVALSGLVGMMWGCDAVEGGGAPGEPLPSLDGPVEVATTDTGLKRCGNQSQAIQHYLKAPDNLGKSCGDHWKAFDLRDVNRMVILCNEGGSCGAIPGDLMGGAR